MLEREGVGKGGLLFKRLRLLLLSKDSLVSVSVCGSVIL